MVGGDLIQGRNVYLRTQSPPPEVRPNGLPPATVFVGRAAETRQLREWVESSRDDGVTVVLVSGPGGVGASAFAVQWGHRMREELFPHGVLYADLRDRRSDDGVALSDVLAEFLQACGWQADQIPPSLPARVERFRSWTADRRTLVVADHVENEAEVELLRPSSPGSAMIVTSHRMDEFVANQKYRPLRPLEKADSRTLLVKLLGEDRVSAEETEAAELIELVGGVPAALNMAVAQMRRRPRMKLAKVVSDVRTELSAGAGAAGRSIIDVMAEHSYRALSPDAAWTYRQLAWHPGPSVSRDVLMIVVREAGRDADAAVDELLDYHLLDEVLADRLEVHSLVRAHARRQAMEVDGVDAGEREGVRWSDVYLRFARAADHLVTPKRLREDVEPPTIDVPFTDSGSALAWLDAWRQNLASIQRALFEGGRYRQVYVLTDTMFPFYMGSPYLTEMLESAQFGFDAAVADGNVSAQGRTGRFLGRALMENGDHEAAATNLAHAVQLLDAPETRSLWASALEFEGRLLRRREEHDDAINRHRRAREVFEDDGDERGVALQDHFIGQNLLDRSDYEQAVEYLTSAERRLIDSGHDRDVAKIRTDLGRALHANGDLAGAREALVNAANRLADENARRYEAEALLRLAAVTEEEADVASTRHALERVRDLYSMVGHPDLAAVQDRLDQLVEIDTDTL